MKIRLALEAVAAAEGIVVSDEEFEAEINRIAESYKMEADKVKALVSADEVKKDLAVNKAIDLIKSSASSTTGRAPPSVRFCAVAPKSNSIVSLILPPYFLGRK